MKILMMSMGTRGDAEPFVGVGEMLREKGDQVFFSFPEQFRYVAEESGFPFFSQGKEFLDRMKSPDVDLAISGGGMEKWKALLRLARASGDSMFNLAFLQKEIIEALKPDLIIHHQGCAYPLLHGMKEGIPVMMFALQPGVIHEVKGIPHVWYGKHFPVKSSYKIARKGMVDSYMRVAEEIMGGLFSREQMEMSIEEEPVMYNVSPTIFPQPDYWKKSLKVIGFWDRNKASHWDPPAALTEFIDGHEKVMLISFGSMPNRDPERLTRLFVGVLQDLKIPAILNSSGGALVEIDDYDRNLIRFVKTIPYDWALPKMYATIHHGGAGTTHSSLRAGCATMAVPHIADQPIFDKIIKKTGVGPSGLSIHKLNESRLKRKIRDLYTNSEYKRRAEETAARMAAESMADEVYDFIVGK